MILELVRAFFMIFIAEMGDKTQILAMAFSTKYPMKKVLIGVAIGSFLNHALGVLLGSNLYRIMDLNTLGIIAGFSFILFGLWNLKFEENDTTVSLGSKGAIYTVASAFFIGELGDKTQLTAIALSTDAVYPIFVLIGTVTGMVVTSIFGIWIGRKIGNRIDEFYIKITASIIFLFFGTLKLVETIDTIYINGYTILSFAMIILVLSAFLLRPTIKQRKLGTKTSYQKLATELSRFKEELLVKVEDICLGEEYCKVCMKDACPIGQAKTLLSDLLQPNQQLKKPTKYTVTKPFDHDQVFASLVDVLQVLQPRWNSEEVTDIHLIRQNLEMILYQKSIESKNAKDYLTQIKQIDHQLFEVLNKQNRDSDLSYQYSK